MASSARIDELRKKFDENPRRYFAPLANEYRKVGDLEQAIFICQEYLPQQPGHMSGHIVYGQALFESARHEEARAVFETALALDPENLIALRHLGDIARAAGDPTAARAWYRRVLEADPRNEEIGAVLKELGGEALSAAAADGPASAEERTESWARAESSTSGQAPLEAEVDQANAPTLEIEQTPDSAQWGMIEPATPTESEGPLLEAPNPSSDEPALEIPASPGAEAAPAQPPLAESRVEPGAPGADELLDIDDFSIGGAATPTGAPAEAPPTVEAAQEAEPASESQSIDDAALAFEADPYAIAAKPFEPERAGAIEPPSVNHGLEAPADVLLDELIVSDLPQAEQESAPPPAPGDTTDGLQPFDGSVSGRDAEAPAAPPIDGFYMEEPVAPPAAVTPPAPHGAAPIGEGLDAAATPEASHEMRPTPSAPTEMFVTETMAQLYLQQGHLEAAVDTYRRLVANRPNDAGLRSRMEEAERLLRGPAPTAARTEDLSEPVAPDATTSAAAAGPTIREFLAGLFGGGASMPAAAPAAEGHQERAEWTEQATGIAPSNGGGPAAPVGESATTPEPAAAPPAAGSGSLDALFSGLQPSPSDENAAMALAHAFAPEPQEILPLKGMPARRASDELSLGHVFKSKTPARGAASDFSFDQFFADEMTRAPTATTENAAAAPSSSDDVAQFSAWLNGLKKT